MLSKVIGHCLRIERFFIRMSLKILLLLLNFLLKIP
jgi:hypothetical protein